MLSTMRISILCLKGETCGQIVDLHIKKKKGLSRVMVVGEKEYLEIPGLRQQEVGSYCGA